ncbi:MAG TPA: DUF1343 domain-containing protein [Candidatus Coprenecus stercoravium]|uniref:DUF1343 domain-containing protein n=1 Tax=Candidatus Coprenecus stercoravium TaxID=2840735 RepID=A0A9D2GPU3_9BACT|nr:DUF1343 domain-containing protein [Candidatus Coprenecus stercoravium]
MFSFRTTPLDHQEDMVLRKGRLGVLCNQSAWNPDREEYLVESLFRNGNLKKVLYPEGTSSVFGSLGLDGCTLVPFSTDAGGKSPVDAGMLEGIDALVVDFQDTGSRYDSLTAVLYEVFQTLHHNGMQVSVYILDRENMCGRWVEGTALGSGASGLAGIEGIPHRHGLTLGELANLFYSETGARFPLHIISYLVRPATQYMMPWSIPPRPDIPGLFTSNFYCGMVLLSGTDLSSGEGTSRPYEFFGAPYLSEYMRDTDSSGFSDSGVFLRKAVFVPRKGRYEGQKCFGFQLLPKPGVPYHSVAHALRIIRKLVQDGAGTDVSALSAVAGDEIMCSFVHGRTTWDELKEHVKVEEQKWIRKAKRYMLYDDQLSRVKTFKSVN